MTENLLKQYMKKNIRKSIFLTNYLSEKIRKPERWIKNVRNYFWEFMHEIIFFRNCFRYSSWIFFRIIFRGFSFEWSFAAFFSKILMRIFFRIFFRKFSFEYSFADFLLNILSRIFFRLFHRRFSIEYSFTDFLFSYLKEIPGVLSDGTFTQGFTKSNKS